MKMIRSFMAILSVLFSLPLIASSDLGRIDFPNSGSPEAQEPFIRGVLLLHSFEYEDSREAFREAQTIDPDFALAYWGEAMTHNHPLWRQQNLEAARRALSRFASTRSERIAKTPTERERGYLDAVEILYGEGDKVERDLAYSDAMSKLAEQYPNDLEAKAFYALSILGTAEGVRDFRIYMMAGAVAEEVFAANPRHPGAVHYMIHSYDDPIHAPLGIRPARVYAQIAPAASHAQHMISHIYVALGRWADSVQANVNAVNVSIERRKRKHLGPDALSYHALHWLEYSYLELGRLAEARETMELMTRHANESGSGSALWHHAAMRATWIVETGGMEGPPEIQTDATRLTGAAASLFATGYRALLDGNRDAAADAAERIAARREAAVADRGGSYEDDVDAVTVMLKSLNAAIELDAGNDDRAQELMIEATSIEDSMPLEYGPPTIVKPSHELYGEMLLELQRPAEAIVQFEKALERAPRRTLSLTGLAEAARATGNDRRLAEMCSEIREIYSKADENVEPPGVCSGKRTM